MRKAYVFLSGELKGSREYYRELIDGADIYCGDGGANYAAELSLIPREVWGDMDSVDEAVLENLRTKGCKINNFLEDKDFTDGELILEYVSNLEYDRVYVVGGFGGRIDHTLTNTNLLFKYSNISFITEEEEVFSIGSGTTLEYPLGTTISFIPFTDTVEGLTLEGFKFPLDSYLLKRGASICMSNVVTGEAKVSFKRGKILCVVQKKQRKEYKV